MQHYTPGIMRGIQSAAEPLLGGAFQWSANRYSQKWAYENGFDADSPEAQARAEELYQHEVSHLPHAFVWTGSAAGINIGTQKYITRNPGKTSYLIAGKTLGSIGTLGLVLALRSLAPNKIQQLDEWNTEKLAKPITRRVSRWFGISDETVDRVFDREREYEDGHHLLEKHEKHHKGGKAETNSAETTTPADDEATPKPQRKVHGATAQHVSPMQLTRLIG